MDCYLLFLVNNATVRFLCSILAIVALVSEVLFSTQHFVTELEGKC